MRPKKIIFLDSFPRNNSGKINRTELIKIATDYIANKQKEIIKPKTQTERVVYNIIEKQVESENISIEDDFVNDLGIDSLMMANIFSELSFYNIKIQDLYNYPTIKSLSAYISGKVQEKPENFKDVVITNNSKKFVLDNVLLTGATGFLGIHLLDILLKSKEVNKIYCIIRRKEFKTGIERLKEKIKFYFKDYRDLDKIVDKKVVVLEGNLSEKDFDLSKTDYDLLKNNVDSVINCAANVKHFAKLEDLMYDNVESVKQLISFCEDKISLAHISTLSISGFKDNYTEEKVFDEDTFYIKQDFGSNPYLLSKFKAESLLLKANNLNLKIFRMGNIMPRVSDGKFQTNYNKNSFINSIRNVVINKEAPEEILNMDLDFSPVDECASFIFNLLSVDDEQKIFHLANSHLITLKDFIEMIRDKEKIEIVTMNKFIQKIEENDKANSQYVKEYFLQGNVNEYSIEKTIKIMDENNLYWEDINKNYINKVFKLIKESKW